MLEKIIHLKCFSLLKNFFLKTILNAEYQILNINLKKPLQFWYDVNCKWFNKITNYFKNEHFILI